MDPIAELLAGAGSTGAVVALCLATYKAMEVRSAKKNGGSVYRRIEAVEQLISQLHSEFREFREETRIRHAKDDVLREVKNG